MTELLQRVAYRRVGRSIHRGRNRPRNYAYCDIIHFMGLQFCYLLRLVVNGSGVQVMEFNKTALKMSKALPSALDF